MNGEELRQTFEKFWADIRGFSLYAGQPSNSQSAAAVSIAREAVRLATEAADADLLLEAHDMLRYGLTANEQSLDALPYYEQVIAGYETRGNLARASRIRIGYVEALLHSGCYDEAFRVARIAEQWLKENGDDEGYARLCTGVANAYSRLDQHQRSHQYYAIAAHLFEQIGDRAALAKIYLNSRTRCTNAPNESAARYNSSHSKSNQNTIGRIFTICAAATARPCKASLVFENSSPPASATWACAISTKPRFTSSSTFLETLQSSRIGQWNNSIESECAMKKRRHERFMALPLCK